MAKNQSIRKALLEMLRDKKRTLKLKEIYTNIENYYDVTDYQKEIDARYNQRRIEIWIRRILRMMFNKGEVENPDWGCYKITSGKPLVSERPLKKEESIVKSTSSSMGDLNDITKRVLNEIYNAYFLFRKQHKDTRLFINEAGLQAQIYHKLLSNNRFAQKYHVYPESPYPSCPQSHVDIMIFNLKDGENAYLNNPLVMLELKYNSRPQKKGSWFITTDIPKAIHSLTPYKEVPLRIVVIFDPTDELDNETLQKVFESSNLLYAYFDCKNKGRIYQNF